MTKMVQPGFKDIQWVKVPMNTADAMQKVIDSLNEENAGLQKIITDLNVENVNLKQQIERLKASQTSGKVYWKAE